MLTTLAALTAGASSLLRRDVGDLWRADHRRGEGHSPSLPALPEPSRAGPGPAEPRVLVSVHMVCQSSPVPASPQPPPLTLPALPSQMAEQLMTLAYDNGINLFDTAEVYAAGK